MFTLSSSGFDNGDAIPRRFTCDGDNTSPELTWSGEPAGTQSFVLIMDDPDAPAGTWSHWLLWDIPATVHSLPEDYRASRPAHAGVNDFGKSGYGGPCPPKRHGPHRYFFRLYALSTARLEVRAGADRKGLDRALKTHVLGMAEYMGTYERA
jgi:Raf kinase inhibitor-like YbhB/YbcL family protein